MLDDQICKRVPLTVNEMGTLLFFIGEWIPDTDEDIKIRDSLLKKLKIERS